MSDKRDVAADIKLAEENRSYWRACREEMVHPLGDLVASLPDYLTRCEAAECRVTELEGKVEQAEELLKATSDEIAEHPATYSLTCLKRDIDAYLNPKEAVKP